MKTLPLGSTGVEVSALSLGTMQFGTRNDRETSYQMLNLYTEAGGTFLDTANGYAHWLEPWAKGGESETLLGEWLRERGNRDQWFIATKVGFDYPDAKRGLSARQIEQECDKSLKRLGIDTIDLYYAHKDDYHTPLEETMLAFDQLIQAGKVRFIGASNYFAWRLEEAHWSSQTNDWAEYCCLQQRYSYLRPGPRMTLGNHVLATEDIFDYARRRGITVLAFSAMLGGAYTRSDRALPDAYAGPDSEARLAALKAVAAEVGATPTQVVLAWMLHSDPPVLPLISASSPEVMRDNLGALDVRLSADQMERLNRAGA
ncbi:MAG: aldo/keto reductase [Anaerolineae bacterium]|nr:aldo/keto reductase [Anaerolineae bacterium]